MASRVGLRRATALGALMVCTALVTGCGSAGRGNVYSVQQVKSAFASHGVFLHKNSDISMRGATWLSSPDTGRYHDPGVIVVVISPSFRGQFTYQSRGRHAPLKKLGDVRAVVWDKTFRNSVDGALVQLSKENAPSAPTPATTTISTTPPPVPTFAQLLAKVPEPLRDAVRKTATVPSAHVVLTGFMTGSGDFSTVKQIASLSSRVDGYSMDEIIVGKTVYRRSSIPGHKFKKWSGKWFKQNLSQSPGAISTGWPGVGLLTFVQPLAMLSGGGHVSVVGRERIRGVETTHYRDRIALGGGLGQFPPSLAGSNMEEVLDVWVGTDDGLIRRGRLCFAGMNDWTANLSRFGEKVRVTIPAAQEVITPPTAGHGKPSLSLVTGSDKHTTRGGSRCG